MSVNLPAGFRFAGLHCGIKKNPAKFDFTLVECPSGAVAAGVYTQNLVFAAPVAYDRALTPSADIRLVAVNSGNANACTGERGDRDAAEMARIAASACGYAANQCLVMSTGVIGHFLPMEKIAAGAQAAAARLGGEEADFLNAADGILTTDQGRKISSRWVTIGDRKFTITGMCKGAGMIGPNMATMLGIVLTDAPLAPADAQSILKNAADASFNCVSVEGHMSTNDTLVLLASGAAGGAPLQGDDLATFEAALRDLCINLAVQIPDDGEGATHLIAITVRGLRTREDARTIATTVADSALVKTAIAGGDPNWGRIVSAAGYAGVKFDPRGVDLSINGHEIYRAGAPLPFEAKTVSQAIKSHRTTDVVLTFREGTAAIRFWTSDLTVEYVKFNADYTT